MRSTLAQLSRNVCSSSTTRVRMRALASGPSDNNALTLFESALFPALFDASGVDMAILPPPPYAGIGPHCRTFAAGSEYEERQLFAGCNWGPDGVRCCTNLHPGGGRPALI